MYSKLQFRTIGRLLCAIPLFLLFWNNSLQAQHQVSGVVVDASTSEPLPGVTVLIQGTERGTATDLDGVFQLDAPSGDVVLIFTFIGYERQEVELAGRSELEVEMMPDILVGEDIVVMGYGIQERASVTGSVAVVDTDRLMRRATPSIEQALQGQASGVTVQSSGHPGAEPNIQIRGTATFGNNRPLYIIDGVPVDNISDFNMRDVESLQVLKDASAAAIYGSRAANGVVIITTRQGQEGALQVDYEMALSRHDIPESRWYDMANREQYQFLNNLARENVGEAPIGGNDPNSEFFVDDIDTNWQREAFRTGYMQDHNLTISGGSERSRYSVSGNFMEQEGTMRGQSPYYDRRSIRVNSDHSFGNLRVGQSLYYSKAHQDHQTTDHLDSSVENIIKMAPTIPVFDESNVGGYGGAETHIQNAFLLNPIGMNNLVENTQDFNRSLVNVWGEYDFIDNLSLRVNYSFDRRESTNFFFEPIYYMGFAFNNDTAELAEGSDELTRQLLETVLSYQTNIGNHGFDVMAGYSEEQNDFHAINASARGFTEPYFKVLDAGPDDQSVGGFRSLHNLRSFFGRLNYNYDDRYLFSGTIRRDGSSRFSTENRYGTFPSASVGWRISNEDFFDVNYIDDLRLRASYGTVGNQDIGDFPFTAFINTNQHYNFGGTPGLGMTVTELANPFAKWETNVSIDFGVDVEMLGERLLFTADYYINESHDILVDVPIPNHVGVFGNPTVNAAEIRNTGLEFSVTWRDNIGNLGYNLSANATTISNEVLSLGTRDEPITGSGSRTQVGSEVGQFYGYVTDGIFQEQSEIDELNANSPTGIYQNPGTSPGDIRFLDLTGDGQITSDDQTFLGSAIPDLIFGFNADFNYRNWDLSMFFHGTYGNDIYNRTRARSERAHEYDNYPAYFMTDTWTPDRPDARLPRMAFGDPNGNARMSDRWIEDGSFIKLQNLQLGYSVSPDVVQRFGISRFRVYLSGQNLFTITNYSGMDPDIGPGGDVNNPNNPTTSRGTDGGSWPNPRILQLGLQLSI